MVIGIFNREMMPHAADMKISPLNNTDTKSNNEKKGYILILSNDLGTKEIFWYVPIRLGTKSCKSQVLQFPMV